MSRPLYLTFSHALNTWLAGRPGQWMQVRARSARWLAAHGWQLLDV